MATTTTEPTFTLDDVRRHNAAGDAWIVVDGAVYDVSKFAAMHPGGRHVLNQQAGKDASALFKLFHNDTVLRKYSRMLRKGKLADADADGAGGGASAMAAAMGFFGDVVPYGDPIWYTRFNSPYYKETHRRWRATVRAFCEKEIFPGLDKWQYSGKRPPADLMRKMGDAGLLAAMHGPPWPREYLDASARAAEPEDFDYFHELILYDEIARQGNAAVVAALTNGCAIALPAVMRFGSEEMRRRVAPDVLMGRELIALAISEPNAGSDVAGMALEARRDGDSYVLNGNKKWITNGMYSKYFVTAVVTGPKGGDPRRGLSLMLVDRDTPGFSTRKVNVPMADISGTAYLDFDDCRVPASALIGEQNKGFKLIMYNFNHERFYITCNVARLARVCLEESVKYALRRKTFGKFLHEHQAIRLKVAHMARLVEQLQCWLEYMTYQMCTMSHAEANAKIGDVMCLLKVQGSKTYELCARECTQVFGGNALYMGGVGTKIVNAVAQVKGYQIPGGAEDVMDDFAARAAFKMARQFSKL